MCSLSRGHGCCMVMVGRRVMGWMTPWIKEKGQVDPGPHTVSKSGCV
jgi:hypothetical protein